MSDKMITRRRLLTYIGVGASGALLAACQPKVVVQTVEVEKVVKETVVVETEKVVKEAVEVEKEVTRVVAVEKAPEKGPNMILWAPKHFIEAQNQYFTDSALLAAARNNFDVEVQLFPWGDYTQKQNAAAEAGTLPDVMVGASTSKHHAMDLLEDVTDLFDEIALTGGGFFDSDIFESTLEGKKWTIPFHNEAQFNYYRKDIFEAAGYTLPFKDLTEFTEAAKAVTDPAKGMYGFGNSFANCPDGNNAFHPYMWNYGAHVQDESGNITVNTPEMLEAIKFYTGLYTTEKVMPEAVASWDDTGNNKAYLAGQCACIFNSGSVLYAIRNDDPELLEKTAVGQLPAGPNGSWSFLGGSVVGLMKGTKSREQSEVLIKGILSPERYPGNMIAAAYMFYPVLKDYMKLDFYQNDAWAKDVVDMLPNTTALYVPGEPQPWIDDIGGLWLWSEMLASVALKDVPPQQALDEFEAKVVELKAKYANR